MIIFVGLDPALENNQGVKTSQGVKSNQGVKIPFSPPFVPRLTLLDF